MRKAIKRGLLRVNSNFKYIVLLWGTNSVFAILLTGPVFLFLQESLQHNVQADKLTGTFDYLWFVELNFQFREIIETLPTILIMAGTIFVLLQVFLFSGIYQILTAEAGKNHFIDFFYGCVRYFYRFFKIFLISVVCYVGLYFVNIVYLNYNELLSMNSESEFLIILFNLLRYFTIVLLFGTLNLIFDYFRIRIIIHQNYNVLKDLWLSFKFVIKKFWRVSTLYWFFVALGLLLYIIHTQINNYFNPTNYISIFAIFIVNQIFIFTKVWMKLFFISSQIEFYRRITLASARTIKVVQVEIPLEGVK